MLEARVTFIKCDDWVQLNVLLLCGATPDAEFPGATLACI